MSNGNHERREYLLRSNYIIPNRMRLIRLFGNLFFAFEEIPRLSL